MLARKLVALNHRVCTPKAIGKWLVAFDLFVEARILASFDVFISKAAAMSAKWYVARQCPFVPLWRQLPQIARRIAHRMHTHPPRLQANRSLRASALQGLS